MFASVFISVTNFSFIKIGGYNGISFVIVKHFNNGISFVIVKHFKTRPVGFSLNGWVV